MNFVFWGQVLLILNACSFLVIVFVSLSLSKNGFYFYSLDESYCCFCFGFFTLFFVFFFFFFHFFWHNCYYSRLLSMYLRRIIFFLRSWCVHDEQLSASKFHRLSNRNQFVRRIRPNYNTNIDSVWPHKFFSTWYE